MSRGRGRHTQTILWNLTHLGPRVVGSLAVLPHPSCSLWEPVPGLYLSPSCLCHLSPVSCQILACPLWGWTTGAPSLCVHWFSLPFMVSFGLSLTPSFLLGLWLHFIPEQGLLISLGSAGDKKAECGAVGSLAGALCRKPFSSLGSEGTGPD